ncbi:UDP-N-acetylglucosamine 2-epimerase [Christiangramia aquimixticola]|uniref:UDP-N-acetylglucosamine 2-epimerase n=1 Tax=Christiangramia aquimixticola TaxID=1697558 RepID=UPI003AA7AD52
MKITVFTGTRAEYGLLRPLIKEIQESESLELQLIVTGMHLSKEFGYTVNEIVADGFIIAKKVECIVSSDSAGGITKSIGLALMGFADALDELSPDLVVILGDRSEMLAAATASMIANIPIAHIHGGDTTEGAYDEGIRHAITKMSYWHFPSTEIYEKRIIQLGEAPDRVFNVGAIILDSIRDLKLLDKSEFEQSIDFKLNKKNILVTFHPVTLENNSAKNQFASILESLDNLTETNLIFTYANSDKGGRVINKMIEEYVLKNKENSVAFKSLGQLRYLSALQFMDLVIGNSSSGIVEVPYFKIPTINIGDRQKGRVAPLSVLQTRCNQNDIQESLKKAYDPSFLESIKDQEQVYGNGNTTKKILEVISRPVNSTKKRFYDIKF